MEMKTAHYSSDISQTALALLALLAAGKDIEPAAIRVLLEKRIESDKNLFLTFFSDNDTEEWDRENPVIIPFTGRNREQYPYSNAYGTLSLRNKYQNNSLPSYHSSETDTETHLRVFSPDVDDYTTNEKPFCAMTAADSATSCTLKVYQE